MDPSPSPPGTISGTERLGWTQAAADAAELATFRYAIYVDSVRSELSGASCAPAAPDFSCMAPLPSMPAGAHTLELASFIVVGDAVLESARSVALQVTVSPRSAAPAQPVAVWPHAAVVRTEDGLGLRLEQIAGDIIEPTDFAFAPDGRMFVAERDGRIRVVRGGRLLAVPALSLQDAGVAGAHVLAVAVDLQFDRTHWVYAIYTTSSPAAGPTFTLARFREAGDTLAEQVVLREHIPASSPDPSASLRVGADGKLFAAFDDGGLATRAGDLASPNGKILRLNPDGTTPRDQAGGTPLYSYPYFSPRGLDWQPASNTLWIADRDSESSGRLSAVVASGAVANIRGLVRSTFTLPRGTLPSSVAFGRPNSVAGLRHSLFVASEKGRHLFRIQFDPLDSTRVIATERLLQDQIGGIRLVGVAPDGTIYLGTASAVGKLVPGD